VAGRPSLDRHGIRAVPVVARVPLTGLGLQPDGTMQVPTDAKTVGWFTKAPTPGSLGPAVLTGR
jgi:hypothetical protein